MCERYHIFISGEHAKVFDPQHSFLISYLCRAVLDTMHDILLPVVFAITSVIFSLTRIAAPKRQAFVAILDYERVRAVASLSNWRWRTNTPM